MSIGVRRLRRLLSMRQATTSGRPTYAEVMAKALAEYDAAHVRQR